MSFTSGQQVFIRVGDGSTAEEWPGYVTHAYGDGTYDVEPFEEDKNNESFPWGVVDESRLRPLA